MTTSIINNTFQPSSNETCPAEIQNKLVSHETNAKQLENQLQKMESEIQHIRSELKNVQQERQQLEQQRKLLSCTAPCALSSCSPYGSSPSNHQTSLIASAPYCDGPSLQNIEISNYSQQFCDLREKYFYIQDDCKKKIAEVSRSCEHVDIEEARICKNYKENVDVNQFLNIQAKSKISEHNRNKFIKKNDQDMEQDQSLIHIKQKYREAQDELEELKYLSQSYLKQLQDYRTKYLQVQDQAEEQQRLLDMMELDNARINQNVTLEIGFIKDQFQEKLSELAPLSDLLRQTQVKFHECNQQRILAERNCENLSKECLNYKEKLDDARNKLKILQNEYSVLSGKNGSGSEHLDNAETKNHQLVRENDRLKNDYVKLVAEYEHRLEDRLREHAKFNLLVEEIKENSERKLARSKEKCEIVRRDLQEQISILEKEVSRLRAIGKAAEKERNEIRVKMQSQLNRLTETFSHAQGRVKTLQGQIDYLSTSYKDFEIDVYDRKLDVQANFLTSESLNKNPHDSCNCT